jgi:hypothetical protein
MTCPDCGPAFVAGYETGLARRCEMDTAAADHENRHALVRPIILAMVADMNRIMVTDLQSRAELRQARQVAACERNQAEARPWPPETAWEAMIVWSGERP